MVGQMSHLTFRDRRNHKQLVGGFKHFLFSISHMGMGQNLVPLVNIKIAGKWMFIPLKMVLIGIDPCPYGIR